TGIFGRVVGPQIVADATDHVSGVDLATFVAKLNGMAFFDGSSPPTKLPDFPDRREVLGGNRPLKTLESNLVKNGAFDHVRLNSFPSRSKLQANNTVDIPAFKDRAGNQA